MGNDISIIQLANGAPELVVTFLENDQPKIISGGGGYLQDGGHRLLEGGI